MSNLLLFGGLLFLLSAGFRLVFEEGFFRKVFGLSLISHATNLMIILAPVSEDRPHSFGLPAFQKFHNLESSLDPLPQALVLTAIVIGFALTAFLLIYFVVREKLGRND